MRYFWCILASIATISIVFGLWTNSLDTFMKAMVSFILIIHMVGFVYDTFAGKNER